MKKLLCAVLALAMMMTACLAMAETVEEVIAQAQTMTNEELYAKAIEESNGKTLYGIGNSSRGKTAGASFIEMLQKIDPSYTGTIEWSQPKNNSIFTTLNADIKSANHIYSMTLIQDGNQIQTKMLDTGNLLNFIPKEWAEGEGVIVEGNDKPLALQTLNKVFMYNTVGDKTFTNCWDFVAEGVAPLFMGVNSELVGKNFLYMLTEETYANYLKAAFDAMPDGSTRRTRPTRWPTSSCSASSTTSRRTTARSATRWSPSPPSISAACWCTPSCAPSRNRLKPLSTTSPSRRIRTAIRASAAMPTSITSRCSRPPRCRGRAARSSLT